MSFEPLTRPITHLLAGWRRAAEIAPGVVCIESDQVTSIDMLTRFGVTVDEIDSFETIEISPSQLQRADTLAQQFESRRYPK
jgi:hypothetical protein